jgi:hypothetical protein
MESKTVGTFDPTTKRFRTPSKHYIKGQPDITAASKEHGVFFIEVKSAIGRLSAHQKDIS